MSLVAYSATVNDSALLALPPGGPHREERAAIDARRVSSRARPIPRIYRSLGSRAVSYTHLSGAEGYPVSVPSLSRSILGQWTHIFSNNVVNEFRVGYSNLNVQFGGNTIGNTVPVDTNISSALGSIAFADPTLLGFGVNPDFPEAVSYTHLDVYKRQGPRQPAIVAFSDCSGFVRQKICCLRFHSAALFTG